MQTSHSRTRGFFSCGARSHEALCLLQMHSIFKPNTACRRRLALLYLSQMSTTSPSALSTCTPVRPTTRPSTRPLLTSSSHGDYTCADSSNVSFGPMAETTSPTGYEPKNLIEGNSMEVKLMFFHKPSMTSTNDTSESIATACESDLADDQIRNMLAAPLYLQEREASADRSRVYHSFRENSVSSSSHFQGNLPQCSHKRKSSQGTLSDREVNSSGHQPVPRKDETFFRFSDPEEAAKLVLEEQRDHLLVEAKSEILKQECKVNE